MSFETENFYIPRVEPTVSFTIRIQEDVLGKVDKFAGESNLSRNKVVNLLLDYALAHCQGVEYDNE